MHALVFGYGQKEDGGVDKQTENRCRKVWQLYQQGRVLKIYLTVAFVNRDGISMASAMKEFLIRQGVNENDIVVERRGGNTAGEMNVFISIVPDEEKVVFVSTWYHIPRILWLALWRIRPDRFTLGIAWRHANFKKDVLVEFLKLTNAILRPRSSAKVLSAAPSPS